MNTEAYVFSTTELAVLVAALADNMPPLNAVALSDLDITQAELDDAPQRLRDNGILTSTPDEPNVMVAEDVEALLTTALNPNQLFTLQRQSLDVPAQSAFFCIGDETSVCNYVDAAGNYWFVELDKQDEIAQLAVSNLATDGVTGDPRPMSELLPSMQSLSTLLHIVGGEAAAAVGWIESAEAVWLFDATATEAEHAVSVTRETLLAHVTTFVRQTLSAM